MILGAGWPFHLGGITPYLDRTGISERVTGRRFLPPGRGQPARLIGSASGFRPAPLRSGKGAAAPAGLAMMFKTKADLERNSSPCAVRSSTRAESEAAAATRVPA